MRQTALRLLGDRRDGSIAPELKRLINDRTGQTALEALWALNLVGGLDEETALQTLDHADPFVRLWTVRLIGDAGEASPRVAAKLAERAAVEPDIQVRSQLACSAKRLPIRQSTADRRQTAGTRARMPATSTSRSCSGGRSRSRSEPTPRPSWICSATVASGTWPIVANTIEERLMRRFAAAGTRKDLDRCVQLLALAPGVEQGKTLMTGFEAAYSGRSLAGIPQALSEALARFSGQSVTLGLRQGKPQAIASALNLLRDEQGDRAKQIQYLQILGEVRTPGAVPVLLRLGCHSPDNALRAAALAALVNYDDPAIATEVLKTYGSLSEDVLAAAQNMLVARKPWAIQLLQAIDERSVDPRSVPREIVEKFLLFGDRRINDLTIRHFGAIRPATSAELQSQISRLAGVVRSGPGIPKPGRQIFLDQCARCHTLFGKGGNVGPDLTTYRRDDLESMLRNIVNPERRDSRGLLGLHRRHDGRTNLDRSRRRAGQERRCAPGQRWQATDTAQKCDRGDEACPEVHHARGPAQGPG